MIVIATHYQSEDEVPRRKELMNVPFLLDMSHLRKALANLQPRATREEVDRAITALTTTELLRLKQYGDGRVASPAAQITELGKTCFRKPSA